MKECPVCKESFPDELFFCDLDGTPLDGPPDSAHHGSSSRLWSILGVVALLGAVVVSAVAIIFFPRGFSPASTAASGSQASASGRSGSPVTVSAPSSDGDSGLNGSLDATAPNSNTDRLDRNANVDSAAKLAARRAQLLKNQNGDPSLPNPKAAFASDADAPKEEPAAAADNVRPRVTNTPEPAATVTQAKSAEKAADTSDKQEQQSAQLGKNAKKKTTKSDSNDQTNSNKKKGGFLKMFKKIFG